MAVSSYLQSGSLATTVHDSPTPAAITLYSEADCWLLAFEIARQIEAPLVAIVPRQTPYRWLHIAADAGRETLLDVFGARTRHETVAYWSGRVEGELAFRELGRFHRRDDFLVKLDSVSLADHITQMDEDRAGIVARAIIMQYRREGR